MRIVVMSDSHGDFAQAEKIVRKNLGHCDMFIHLGDGERDVDRLRTAYPNLDIRHVKGNCDYGDESPSAAVVTAGGVRIFCTHGHRYNVKSGLDILCENARNNDCRIALFGHTHSRLETVYGGIFVLNPGSCACPRDGNKPSFGTIEIVSGKIVTGIFEV